jgi:hypothetical protein
MYKKSVAIIVPAVLAATMLVTTNASAKPVTLSGTFSRSQVKRTVLLSAEVISEVIATGLIPA